MPRGAGEGAVTSPPSCPHPSGSREQRSLCWVGVWSVILSLTRDHSTCAAKSFPCETSVTSPSIYKVSALCTSPCRVEDTKWIRHSFCPAVTHNPGTAMDINKRNEAEWWSHNRSGSRHREHRPEETGHRAPRMCNFLSYFWNFEQEFSTQKRWGAFMKYLQGSILCK